MGHTASIVGLGVIGASVALGLKKNGWSVYGSDVDARHIGRVLDQGLIDDAVPFVHEDSDLVFVATPPSGVSHAVQAIVDEVSCPITDVASVKRAISDRCRHPMFVPGHPMAGSEKWRLEGASASLFHGATWVLTPSPETDEGALTSVIKVIRLLGAEVRLMDAAEHDGLVAAVSHVPHLLAGALLNTAFEAAAGHEGALARMAAGGFRDMTRVASADSDLWVDICWQNAPAVADVLERLIERLTVLRQVLTDAEPAVVEAVLRQQFDSARQSRELLPSAAEKLDELCVELRRGQGARDVLALSTRLDISVADYVFLADETSDESRLLLSVLASKADILLGALSASGFVARRRTALTN